MKDRQVGLREIIASGSWYAIPVIWGFFAFIRMVTYQLGTLLISCAIGFGVIIVVYVVFAVVRMRRHGKQPSKDEEQSALRTIGSSVFSVVWSAFVVGCLLSMFVVIEYNDPFTAESIEEVTSKHGTVFWSITSVGAVIGAIDRIQRMIRAPAEDTPQKEN